MLRGQPPGHMLLRIGLKLRLVVRRSASGKGHETNEKQEAKPSYRHYL
jgi:hypothetical protein